jgi:hypothetical protein
MLSPSYNKVGFMFFLSNFAKVIFYNQPVNLHKGFDSLTAIAKTELNIEFSPDVYVLFCNSRKDRIKVLFFEKNNVAIFSMRFPRALNFKYGGVVTFDRRTFYDFVNNMSSRGSQSGLEK